MDRSGAPHRGARRLVSRCFELLWSAGFRITGRISRRTPESWRAAGGPVVVIAPHPDDEVAGCAGTLLEHHRAGDTTAVVWITDGRRSRAFGMEPAQMASVRRQEARAAARILAVDHPEWLGLPEAEWEVTHLRARLCATLLQLRPDIVYAPSRIDFHFEHERVARTLAEALADYIAETRHSPILRIYPVQVPLGLGLGNLVTDIGPVLGEVYRAFEAYASQRGALEPCLRHRRYVGCSGGARGPREEFWQMNADCYGLLHREPPARPLVRTFRGLRYDALTDPLAYLRGGRERRRLANFTGTS